jgi:glucosamine-6-phosphate deaminase
MSQSHRLEKISTLIFETSEKASVAVAREIADLIKQKSKEGKPCVLGLATGSSPQFCQCAHLQSG